MDVSFHRKGLTDLTRAKAPAAENSKSRSALKSEESAKHFAWIDWLRERTGIKSDNALAKAAGLTNNYIYRTRRKGTVLDSVRIQILCQHFGVPGPDTYLSAGSGFADEAIKYDARQPGTDPITKLMIEIALRDRPNAAPWTLRTHALEGAGYLPGDILITDATIQPVAQDAVVARIYNEGGADTIFRIWEPPFLMAVTSDRSLRMPIEQRNDRSVIIMGTVTQSFRPRRS